MNGQDRLARRRRALLLGSLGGVLPGLSWGESSLTQALRARGLSGQGLVIDFPRLADSAHAVEFSVEVTAPAGRVVQQLEILLPENPHPLAARLRFPQPVVHYRLSTRLRLAASQAAWALATLDDGTVLGASAPTLVTSSACLDES